jgi:HSP20 family molecular chaperone IbpA
MRSFDFAPYYRSTVGFDRLFSMLDQVGGVEGSAPSYPPYNIARTGENDYRISVAVAGFTDAEAPGRKADQRRGEEWRRALPGHRRAELRT